ncbi:MAG: nucleotidyl transferase AbiEii/AbiGii toxin family protein [Chloroflexi bacterium]|nr:nucleotidyl transferase AbiEii/AbiGii toxin family protein [Chloroflexota bacterium]
MPAPPPLPDRQELADACLETAARERVQPAAMEKDFYLTRLLWALAGARGERLVLKGGTCLSKVDLGYHRMSEDIDLVIPWDGARTHRGVNAGQVGPVRAVLRRIAPIVGLTLPYPDGDASESGAHVIWELPYESAFGPQAITVEVAMRPVLRPPRQVRLRQLLPPDLVPDYDDALCWALDYNEARAEKVRAAFTREEVRDFYDLGLLAAAGVDMESDRFIALVDDKLTEVKQVPVRDQPAAFGLTPARRAAVQASTKGLAAVVRLDEPPFDLDAVLAHYDRLWHKA